MAEEHKPLCALARDAGQDNVSTRVAEIRERWRSAPVSRSDDELYVGSCQVMQSWERPIMRRLAEAVTAAGGHVLEIGFGLGLAADYIADLGCKSYTVVEAHPVIAEYAREWATQRGETAAITVIEGFWQDVVQRLDEHSYDGILFDTYELTEDERGTYHFEFFPHAARLLTASGAFCYYPNDDLIPISTEHVRRILEYFDEVTLKRVSGLAPFQNTNYWRCNEMVIPVAKRPRPQGSAAPAAR
jgi:guanidinoacetate N-methyltransferase